MTELYVKARINDGETGELIEKLEFIYCVEQRVNDMDDITPAQMERLEEEIEERREYERTDGDLYRVDIVVLEEGDEEEEDDAPEGEDN